MYWVCWPFFFSSRRRHTRYWRDWSSDVCSSDLLWERKLIGWIQIRIGPNRVGPLGLLQPIADGVKLLFKEIILPTASSKALYILAPMLAIMPALAAWAGIPFAPEPMLSNIHAGLLHILTLNSFRV